MFNIYKNKFMVSLLFVIILIFCFGLFAQGQEEKQYKPWGNDNTEYIVEEFISANFFADDRYQLSYKRTSREQLKIPKNFWGTYDSQILDWHFFSIYSDNKQNKSIAYFALPPFFNYSTLDNRREGGEVYTTFKLFATFEYCKMYELVIGDEPYHDYVHLQRDKSDFEIDMTYSMFGDDKIQKVFFWIAKPINGKNFSGSLWAINLDPKYIDENYDYFKEVYNYTGEAYAEAVRQMINRRKALVECYYTIKSDTALSNAIDFLIRFEHPEGEKLREEYDLTTQLSKELYRRMDINSKTMGHMIDLVTPITERTKPQTIMDEVTGEMIVINPPNIDHSPRTEEELIAFLEWNRLPNKRYDSRLRQFDGYGTEMRVSLTENGILVISAGEDKQFYTADDIVVVGENGKYYEATVTWGKYYYKKE